MLEFKPTSVSFDYSGDAVPEQSVTILYRPNIFYNNTAHRVQVRYQQSTSAWLKIFDTQNNEITGITQEYSPGRIILRHNSSALLPVGTYSAEVHLAVGYMNGNYMEVVEETFMMVFISVKSGSIEFSVTPGFVQLHLVKSSNVDPSIPMVFTSPMPFKAEGPIHTLLDGRVLPQELPGSGTHTLSINSTARSLENGMHWLDLDFYVPEFFYKKVFVKLLVTNTSSLEVFPTELTFQEKIGVVPAGPQLIDVYDPANNATFNLPSWASVELISNEENFKKYKVSVNSTGLSVGVYSHNVTINSSNGNATLKLNYIIDALFNQQYLKPYHFTQDNENLIFQKAEIAKTTFLNVKMYVKFYTFVGEMIEETRTISLFFRKDKVEFDVGKYIHDMFRYYENGNNRYNNIRFSTGVYPQYKFASVYFSISELDFDTLEVYSAYDIPAQNYVKGIKPSPANSSLSKLLSHRTGTVTRVTRNSLVSFNYIRMTEENIVLRRNGNIIQIPSGAFDIGSGSGIITIPQASDVKIYGGIINLSNISGLQVNEVLELSIAGQKMTYIVEEEGINSVNVFYVNQHDLLSSFELTGEFVIDSDYDRITTTDFHHWMESTRNLNTSKKQTIKINSGYIPLENVRILDEINMSKKVFIVLNGKTIDARPVIGKINNVTSKDNLVERSMEFELINTTYDSFYA